MSRARPAGAPRAGRAQDDGPAVPRAPGRQATSPPGAVACRRSRVELTGARVDDVSMDEAIGEIERLIARRQPEYVVTPNVDHLVKLQGDPEFQRVYDGAALVLADGMPLLWASWALGTPLQAKVSGSDLFVAFAAVAARRGHRLYFLGGREGAAARAAELLSLRNPGLVVCGVDAPPLGFERDPAANAAVLARVREARPDVLFVGLGAPKQEKWIHRWRHELAVPVSIGVGVSFEFVAGMVRRAPRWMQRAGLEWLWRLLMEPRRLWRRYLLEDTRFFGLFLRQWWHARAVRRAAAQALAAASATTDLLAPIDGAAAGAATAGGLTPVGAGAGPSPLPGWPLGAHGPACERACCLPSEGGARERTTHDIVRFPALDERREPDREAA